MSLCKLNFSKFKEEFFKIGKLKNFIFLIRLEYCFCLLVFNYKQHLHLKNAYKLVTL